MEDIATAMASQARRDEQLVARFQAGDARAFDELAAIHLGHLFALSVELLGNRDDAEEVTQEVLIKLYHCISRSRPPARLRAWLYRVCVNQCHDWRRSQRRRPVMLEMTEAADRALDPDPANWAAGAALREALRSALWELPRQQRTAFLLCHFAGLSVNDIAAALGCAPATVRVHLSRATARLRDALSAEVNVDESV